jgi:transposase
MAWTNEWRGTGELRWVFGDRKNSALFVAQIRDLARRYRSYRRIHLILDNFGIHDSRRTRAVLSMVGGKVKLHFLPPYCPDSNPIEHVWKQVHDNVTRNHRCPDIPGLLTEVDDCMHALSPFPGSKASLRRSRSSDVAESAAAI